MFHVKLFPLQHPNHPVKILQSRILDHNLAPSVPIPDPHPHPQNRLQRPLRRLHIRLHPPRPPTLLPPPPAHSNHAPGPRGSPPPPRPRPAPPPARQIPGQPPLPPPDPPHRLQHSL